MIKALTRNNFRVINGKGSPQTTDTKNTIDWLLHTN